MSKLVRAPVHKAGGLGSNPGPDENFSLKLISEEDLEKIVISNERSVFSEGNCKSHDTNMLCEYINRPISPKMKNVNVDFLKPLKIFKLFILFF